MNRPPLPSDNSHDGQNGAHILTTNAALSELTTGPTAMPTLLDRQTLRTVFALGLAAIVIYLPLIGWGLPYATTPTRIKTYAVDELLPLDALAEMHNTFVVSKPDRNYGYPWGHYFALASVQAPYVAYLKLTGQMSGSAAAYPYGLQDPVAALRALTLIGRLLAVAMGAGVVVLAYFLSTIMWDHRTGVLAACLTMLSYPHVYYSRVGNPDVALVFWSALGLVAFALILKDGLTSRRAVWLGLAAGMAMGTKDQGLVVFLPLGIALLFPQLNAGADGRYQWKALAGGLVAACASYLLATGMLVDPKRHLLHVYYLFAEQGSVTWMPIYHAAIPKTFDGILEMLRKTGAGLDAMISLPVLLAAVAGAALAFRTSPRYLVLLLPLPTLFLILTLPTGTVGYRYLYPLTFMVDAFAAAGLVWVGRKYSPAVMVALCIIVLGSRALVAADLSYAQFHETRSLAGDWLRSHARPGDTVEFFGVEQYLPPLPAQIPARRIAKRENWKQETAHGDYVLDYLRRQGPRFVYVTPDHSSQPGMERSADCPPEVYRALLDGSAGYRLAAYFPTPALLPAPLHRPRLDYPAVSPPVRIFERIPPAAPR